MIRKIDPFPVMEIFDGDGEITQLRLDILEKQMPKDIHFLNEIGGKIKDVFDDYGGQSMDIGFLMGFAIGQAYNLPDEKSKSIVENMRKLVIRYLPQEIKELIKVTKPHPKGVKTGLNRA